MSVLFQLNALRMMLLLFFILVLNACVSPTPPSNVNNICSIFREYPKWYVYAKDVERRWLVPVPVQMAIIHQESRFRANAKPPRAKLLGFIPWKRPTSATGYAQALHNTWNEYRHTNGGFLSSRRRFVDGVDFIGWYANLAHRRANINRADAYSLYLAYHEGVGGYLRKTYLRKRWLIPVARKVKARALIYAMQLSTCSASLRRRSWF
jgi:hypothetical protein